jgi:hypothetical protein
VVVHEPRPPVPAPDIADAVSQLVRVAFGIVTLGLGVVARAMDEAPGTVPRAGVPRLAASDVTDLAVASAWGAARLSGRVAASGSRVAAPFLRLALRPPLVPRRLQAGEHLELMVEQWQRDRPDTLRSMRQWSATALPGAVDAALALVDVDQLLSDVLDSVDLDAVASDVLHRIDVDRLVAYVLGGLDLDAVAATAVERIDLAPLVSAVLAKVDLTALVLEHVKLDQVINEALGSIDLTSVVLDQVDLGVVIASALDQMDLTQVVREQVDLIGVAEYVVEGIDLPGMIRDSTGSIASEAVRGLRMQGVDADTAVAGIVDRMLHRRRNNSDSGTKTTHTPDPEPVLPAPAAPVAGVPGQDPVLPAPSSPVAGS